MPRRNPRQGDRVRPRDKTNRLRGYIAPTSSLVQGEVIIRDVGNDRMIGYGVWKDLSKAWLLMKSVKTRRRVLTMPLEVDKELIRLGAEHGRSPEAVAIELLRTAIATSAPSL